MTENYYSPCPIHPGQSFSDSTGDCSCGRRHQLGQVGVTILPYMYRDADNFKAHGDIVVAGAITKDQLTALKASLDVDGKFIPEQIGLGHLGWTEGTWTSFPSSDDHVWHELLGDEFRVEERDARPPVTVDEMVQRFTDVGPEGWDDTSRYSLDD